MLRVLTRGRPHWAMLGVLLGLTAAGAPGAEPAPSFARLPLAFEPNRGQAQAAVRFLARGAGYALQLTDQGAALALRAHPGQPQVVVRMTLEGSAPPSSVTPEAPTGGLASYFRGNDPTHWRTAVPMFARVAYRGVYPGVDLVYYGREGALEFDFVLAPGADPGVIELRWEGVRSLRVDSIGDLVLHTVGGELRQHRPRIYQEVDGQRVEIEGRYQLRGARRVGFRLARYDAARPLVIDPILTYSTFLGGSGDDFSARIAVDGAGNAYVTGQTTSADFPATGGALDTTSNGSDDVFVAKLNPAGTAIVYSTYLGGSGADSGTAIAVDSSGNAYVTGSTESSNFPTTAGAFDTTANGGTDVFVAKLNPTGTALVYSTFLGGSGLDAGWAVAVDSVGSAYVAGTTWSVGFPTTAGAFDTSHNGGADVFVAKVNSSGNGLAYATFLGGSGEDAALDLALDSTGNAYLTGFTSSSNFPVTSGAYDTSFNGGSFSIDAFVTNLNPTGTALLYSTFLGSNGDEWGHRIAVDAAGSAYVAGQTWSGAFPTTTGAFDTSFNGLADVFVSKLTPTGAGLSYSTFLGGADYDSPTGLAVDAAGRVALAGRTTSANYPVTAGATDPSFNGLSDAFLTRLNAAGSQLLYSSFVGGAGHDSATGLALDAAGNVYVSGFTYPIEFPTTTGAYDTSWNGGFDVFLVKQLFGPSVESVTPSSGSGATQTFSFVYSHTDGYAALSWGQVIINATLSGNSSCFLHYNREANQVWLQNDTYSGWLGPVTPGTTATLYNSQCIVSGAGSSVTGSGSTLTVNLVLSFRSAFAGAKTTYMLAQDIGGFLTGWQTKGSWTATSGANEPPSAVSVSPSSGSGSSQTFSFVYSDPNGYADLPWAQMIINATLSEANSCFLHYNRLTHQVSLQNDSFTGWLGPLNLGAAGTIQNSQCIVSGTGSSASGSGVNLTVSLALSFKSAFAGAKTVYMQTQDTAGWGTGWQAKGAWTALPAVPTAVSVSPSSGSGSTQTFSFVYSDPDGYTDLPWVQMMVNATTSGASSCYLHYNRAVNQLWLQNDTYNGWLGPLTPGTSAFIYNSQCVVTGAGSSVTGSGTTLTVNLALTFRAAFAGAKNIYMQAEDSTGLATGWQTRGTWTATTGGNEPPSAVSVSPNSGSGSTQTFSFVFSDLNGFADLPWVQMIINATLTGANSCFLHYNRAVNQLWLQNDTYNGWLGPLTPGAGGVVYNSQCTVSGVGSSVSGSGSTLTLNLALTFRAAFAGAKNIYMQTQDAAGLATGWQTRGSWTATAGGNEPPSAVSVTPSSGSGSTQTFSFVYSDPNGFADLPWVQMMVNATTSGASSCYLHYNRAVNQLWLQNDTYNGWLGPLTPGTSAFIYNSQCVVTGAGSSVTGSGTTLTVNLALTFRAAFAGAKNIYMQTQDNGGLATGWQTKGAWTATAGGNEPPSAVSVSPSSGSGSAQTFSFLFSDPNGYTDLPWVQMIINATNSGASSCFLHYNRAVNQLWLQNDTYNGWLGPLTPGSAGTVENSQCAVSGAASSVSGSGVNLTLNLALSFKPAFAGAKNIYMQTQDNGGLATGWQTRGSWIVP